MKPKTRLWLFAFILLGLVSSLGSFYIHDRMLRDPAYSTFCNVSPVLNCEIAYQSRFAAFYGVPVALIGVIWFTLAFLLVLADAAAYLFLISIPALSVVLLLAYASTVVLKVVCILCGLTYLAVLGVFVISGATPDARLDGLPRRAVRDARALAARPIALGVAILFLAGAVSAMAFFSRPAGNVTAAQAAVVAEQASEFDIWFEAQVRAPISLPADGAKVLIVEFTDYQSPVAAEAYKVTGPVLAKYQKAQPGNVKIVSKDYPLDPTCNRDLVGSVRETHKAACEAAVAVRLAQRQGRGAAMEEWLYTHQTGLTPAVVRQAAMDIGGVTDFDSQFPQLVAQVKSDGDLARQLRINAMPTFFINGVRIEGSPKPEILDKAIAHELKVSAKR